MQDLRRSFDGLDLNALRMIVYAIVLIALMILRPEGLLGERELLREEVHAEEEGVVGVELVLQNVTKNFGGLRAVGDVSFTVKENAIFGLIGPNGAGKTTVFNLITGVYKHDSGSIKFGKTDLAPLKPARIAGVGIGRTFQNIRLFGQLTVIENLLVACELQKKAHLGSAILRLPVHFEDERSMTARAMKLLAVFDLDSMADDTPTALSYGNQRRLEIARAMMLDPKLLLLDEPAAGMNYGEAEGLKTQIRWLRDEFALSVVLVEHKHAGRHGGVRGHSRPRSR